MKIITITQGYIWGVRHVYAEPCYSSRAGESLADFSEGLAEVLSRRYGDKAPSLVLKLKTKAKGRETPIDWEELRFIKNQLNRLGFSGAIA